jgi:putative protease
LTDAGAGAIIAFIDLARTEMAEEQVGVVDEYFARIGVVGIALSAPLRVGDVIHIKGHTTDFQQPVESMQADHGSIAQAEPGTSVGVKVSERCRHGDHVYKVT